MVHKNKAKGTYHEKYFVRWLASKRIRAKRQPLSGSLGGEYAGDLIIHINGRRLVGEVKYRDTGNFPSPFKVLEGRHIAFYKKRRGQPSIAVIMDGDTFLDLIGDLNGHDDLTEPDDPCSSEDG